MPALSILNRSPRSIRLVQRPMVGEFALVLDDDAGIDLPGNVHGRVFAADPELNLPIRPAVDGDGRSSDAFGEQLDALPRLEGDGR